MSEKKNVDRRGFLRKSIAASAGAALGLHSFEEQNLLAKMAQNTEGTAKPGTSGNKLPFGKIKNLNISRIFCGGNLIGGWAHSRDLMYVSSLVKAYHTDEKVFETLELAEENGINAILTNPVSDRVINRYWDERGGKIQWMSDCASGPEAQSEIHWILPPRSSQYRLMTRSETGFVRIVLMPFSSASSSVSKTFSSV